MKKPPYAFLFGKHPPPLQLVKDTLLDAFCTDRGTLHASDLPELDLDREWWCVTRSAFNRLILSSNAAATAIGAMLDTFLPYFRPKRSEYWRKRRPAAGHALRAGEEGDGNEEGYEEDVGVEVGVGAERSPPPPIFTYTDFHRFLRQLTEPHGLIWIKTINYLGTQEYPAFYVGFPAKTKENTI